MLGTNLLRLTAFLTAVRRNLRTERLPFALKKAARTCLNRKRLTVRLQIRFMNFSIWILLLFFLKFRLLISKRQCKRLLRKDEQRSSIKRKRKKKTSTTSFGTNFLFLKIHLKKYTARQFTKSRRILPMFQPRTAI